MKSISNALTTNNFNKQLLCKTHLLKKRVVEAGSKFSAEHLMQLVKKLASIVCSDEGKAEILSIRQDFWKGNCSVYHPKM